MKTSAPIPFLSILLAIGCDVAAPDAAAYELPAGWEDATHVAIYLGPASGGCGTETATQVEADVVDERLDVLVDGLVVSCAQPHEGFVREREGGYDLLLQPVDMNPDGLAGCVCATKIRVAIGSGAVGGEVEVFHRPSFPEGGELESLGVVLAQEGLAGCEDLAPCDVDTPCEVSEDPEEYSESCVDIVGCGGVCVSAEEACMMSCGTLDCAILESNPEQVSCE